MRHLGKLFILWAGMLLTPQVYSEADPANAPVDEAGAEEKARKYFTDLEVVDQNGRRLRFYTDVLKGRVVLINFVFTNCPDACPMITQKLVQVRNQLVDSVKDDIWFVSISVDPERDTPASMKAFAAPTSTAGSG